MKATLFVIILLLNDGNLHKTSMLVPHCPLKDEVYKNYEKLREAHEFKDWTALCTTVNFGDREDLPNDDQTLELEV